MTDMVEKLGPKEAAMKIRYLYQQALSITTSYIIEIGRVLTEQKDTMEHGAWGKWLEEEVGFSASTAQNYMKIYKRFGSEQISIFGSTKTEAIGTLPYTKALKLLAVPDEEMDDFLEEHDVDKMSTRELEQAIRERDAARAELEQQKATSESYKESALKFKNFAEDRGNAVKEAEAAAAKAKAEADKLRAELEELQSRPVEVAVEAPSEEMLAEIRAAEEAKFQAEREALQKRAADAEAKAKKQADKAQKLKEQADKAAEQAKAELQKDLDAAAKAQADAEARAKDQEARADEMERRLKLADSDTAVFQVYFQRVQEDCNRMLGLIKKADQAQADKYRAAIQSLLGAIGKMIGGGDE